MKKYGKWLLVLVIVAGTVFYRSMADRISFYNFYDNENGFYDTIYDYLGTGGLAPSKEKLETIEALDFVEGVYPVVYFNMRLDDEDWQETPIYIEYYVDQEKHVLELPVKYQTAEGDAKVMYDLFTRGYSDETYIINETSVTNETALAVGSSIIVKKFTGVESGVYITDALYNLLDCDDSAKSLQLIIPLYVPTKMTIDLVHHQSPVDEYGIPISEDEFDFYAEGQTITGYQLVYYTFEVEGVIQGYSGGIRYPIEQTTDILSSVNEDEIQLEDNEVLYEPNNYQIKLTKKKSLKWVAKELDKVIDEFAVEHYFYHNQIISFSD